MRDGKGYDVLKFAVTSTVGNAPWVDTQPTAAQEEWPMAQTYAVQRAENRKDIKTTALLIGRHGRLGVERAITENVSPRGVRVISTSEWDTDDTILIALPEGHFTSAARVTYCDPMGDGRFGTGLEFVGKDEQLEISALAVAPQS